MATEADHIALANKNHDVLLYLLDDAKRFPEWIAVAAFYKAVQIVEAVFVHKHGMCCHGHTARLQSLKSRGYSDLHRHYRALWSASCVARYLYDTNAERGYSSFSDYLPADRVRKMVRKRLLGIESAAVNLLSPHGRAALDRFPDSP